jgi:GYF domain 2
MNYFIKRDLNEYGPYSLADLQKYVASGNILLTDLCRSEGLADWIPVSQVIGNIPVPVAAPQPPTGTVYGGPAAYGGTPAGYGAAAVSQYPPPPSLHWGIALLLTIITCFIFGWVWLFVQAAWMKKVQPRSKAIIFFATALGLNILAVFVTISLGFAAREHLGLLGYISLLRLVQVGAWILLITGCFNMKNSIEEHFNSAEPIALRLNGVITFIMSFFFLGHIYFQYHFTRINEMKQRQMMGYPG